MYKRPIEKHLSDIWYGKSKWPILLKPISKIFEGVSILRKHYILHRLQEKHTIPIIVVGNISLGGTGKTELVIWLVNFLKAKGYQPGIISRGYKAIKTSGSPIIIDKLTKESHLFGDEPVLIKQKTNQPVAVGKNRNDCVRQLCHQYPNIDIIISDDGL